MTKEKPPKKIFVLLWLLCIMGSWSVIPYTMHLGILPQELPFFKLFLIATLQSAIFFGLVTWLSSIILPRTDLSVFSVRKKTVYAGLIFGTLTGFVTYILDFTLFKNSLLSGVHPPFWTGMIASLYGGINEEVLLRLFLFSLFYLILRKIYAFEISKRIWFLWIANLLTALIFGLGHLPAVFKLIGTPSSFEIFRVLVLNGIPGLVFGWLYWSRSLWAAMLAHFVADFWIHAFLI